MLDLQQRIVLAVTKQVERGRDNQADLGGPVANATFLEPVGVAVVGRTVLVVCFGGEAGSVAAVSPTAFAVELMARSQVLA